MRYHPDGIYYREHILEGAPHENSKLEGYSPAMFINFVPPYDLRYRGVEVKDGKPLHIFDADAAPSKEDTKALGKALKAKAKAKAKAVPKKKTVKKKK